MKAMYLGFAAIILIAIAAHFVLDTVGVTTQQQYTSSNVRID